MTELIALIILVISLCGIGFILYSKIPILIELPKVPEKLREKAGFGLKLKEGVKRIFSEGKFLQKILSRTRILTLKADKVIENLLQGLRKKSQNNQKNLPGQEILPPH